MYSPGFFPQGYLCKPGNGGYDVVQAFSARHGFDPSETPWEEVPAEVRQMFYTGDPEPLEVVFTNPKGRTHTRTVDFPGIYGWIRDWDVGGTYTDTEVCPACNGARIRPEYLAVKLSGHNIHELGLMPLKELSQVTDSIKAHEGHPANINLNTVRKRLRFLIQVGLGDRLDHFPSQLSGGEQQRVAIARALAKQPPILLCDEPTGELDFETGRMILALLRRLNRENGQTVLLVTHNAAVGEMADRVVRLRGGKIAEDRMISDPVDAEALTW